MRFLLCILSFLSLFFAQQGYAEVLTATDKVVEKFMELDTDDSESVSFAEYKTMVNERLEQRFQKMDRDRNGNVSEDEYRNFWTQQKSTYYRPRR